MRPPPLRLTLLLGAAALPGCCGQEPPRWQPLDVVEVDDTVEIDLADFVEDDGGRLSWWVIPDDHVAVEIDGSVLTLAPAEAGYGDVTLQVGDACGNLVETTLTVHVPDGAVDDTGPPAGDCTTTVRYTGSGASVAIAGEFDDWTPEPMTKDASGWSIELDLPAGAYTYKLVIDDQWACDPAADFQHCDAGQAWDEACTPGGNDCNSLLVVPDCEVPRVTVDRVDIDRVGGGVEVAWSGDVTGAWATLDGESVDATSPIVVSDLPVGRHTLRIGADGAEPAYVPFWTDGRRWDEGLLYFAFVDRFEDGDLSNDFAEGADVDYAGGDWQGVIDRLDWLDELGVTTIWLTAPVDNPDGAWAGQCSSTYAAYHGYWPASDGLEEHFGSEPLLHDLVDAAHGRGMRVMVDLVLNHVHADHPWVSEHPDWFNPQHICEQDDDGDGVVNWDQRPETCWFATYLPDLDYTQVEPALQVVDAAIAFAEDFEIDGFRVDAVKHFPHALTWNLQSRVRDELEHRDAGGDEDFRTVGETFDGTERIASYLGERQLDAQFDFPLYYAIVQAFAWDAVGLSDGDGSLRATLRSEQAAYGDAWMGTFLGNHDVERFIAFASGQVGSIGGDSPCGDDGELRAAAVAPGWSEPYDRLLLAWAFLLTTEGQPLVYYGDEIGLEGYADPDNRHRMRFTGLSADESRVLDGVRALGQARRDHPAMSHGTTVDWWENEADVWAYGRTADEDAVLVALNRSAGSRTLTNGLSWAGLPPGRWEDVLTGDSFTSADDVLSIELPARSARVLVPR